MSDIPNEIYIAEYELLERYENHDRCTIFTKRVLDEDIKYIKAPIAKKFADVRPTKDGWYLCGNSLETMSPHNYFWGSFRGRRDSDITFDPTYWSEIILPTIEE
jgi:hypothetical protein